MKTITLLGAMLLCALASMAQRFNTSSVSEYQQVYSTKYTLVKTTLDIKVVWEISDKAIMREYGEGPIFWDVTEVIKTPTGNKYMIDALGLDIMWVMVDSGFVYLYENNGQTKRAFRIYKKGPLEDMAP